MSESINAANNVTKDINKGNVESNITLTSINSTLNNCKLDLQLISRIHQSVLLDTKTIATNRESLLVCKNDCNIVLSNIRSSIAKCKVQSNNIDSYTHSINDCSQTANNLNHSVKQTISQCKLEQCCQ